MAINLSKGQKIDIQKTSSSGLGEILIDLNRNSKPVNQGFLKCLFGGNNSGIDLDLGCLYELNDERKGAVQALGN